MNWIAVAYGGVYATPEVFHYMANYYRMSGKTALAFQETGNLYMILDEVRQAEVLPCPVNRSQHKAAPSGMTCFYCGSNHHTASTCPSKALTEAGRSLHKLGYLSVHSIEELARHIQNPSEDIKVSPHTFSVESQLTKQELIAHAFYDLRSVYQLRFHQTVWNTNCKDVGDNDVKHC